MLIFIVRYLSPKVVVMATSIQTAVAVQAGAETTTIPTLLLATLCPGLGGLWVLDRVVLCWG